MKLKGIGAGAGALIYTILYSSIYTISLQKEKILHWAWSGDVDGVRKISGTKSEKIAV